MAMTMTFVMINRTFSIRNHDQKTDTKLRKNCAYKSHVLEVENSAHACWTLYSRRRLIKLLGTGPPYTKA